VLRINGYQNKSEESEHRSFANLLYGIFGTFRNPPAHPLGQLRSGRSPSPTPWTCSRCCRTGTDALSEQPTRPAPPARPEAMRETLRCPVCGAFRGA
jgi:hypothetical protein